MMIKIVTPDSWDFGEEPAQLVKVSSRGLIGHDLQQFIKRAGHVFADQIANIKLAKDEVPVHILALGATEKWGCNRNGDGFSRQTCMDHHGSFVKKAKFYYNHKNKDPKKGYGYVKLSSFNPHMDRIELLGMLNATKEAAERNGNLVADEALEELTKRGSIPVSMACKIAYDVCRSCNNKAKTRSEYCTEDICPGGGCKYNLGKTASDGEPNYVENPNPEWFDISKVHRPADRTAFGSTADYLKSASSLIKSGAELAEDLGLVEPFSFALSLAPRSKTASLYSLALSCGEAETQFETGSLNPTHYANPFAQIGCVPFEKIASVTGRIDSAEVLRATAERQILIPLCDFLKLSGLSENHTEKVAAVLPGVFNRILGEESAIEAVVMENPFMSVAVDAPIRPGNTKWAQDLAVTHSYSEQAQRRRIVHIGLYDSGILKKIARVTKQASSDTTERIARAYAAYQLAFLAAQEKSALDLNLLTQRVVSQNYVRVQG